MLFAMDLLISDLSADAAAMAVVQGHWSPTVRVSREEPAYTWDRAATDVGGAVGLLLGLSAWGAYQHAEGLLFRGKEKEEKGPAEATTTRSRRRRRGAILGGL